MKWILRLLNGKKKKIESLPNYDWLLSESPNLKYQSLQQQHKQLKMSLLSNYAWQYHSRFLKRHAQDLYPRAFDNILFSDEKTDL